MEVLTAKFFNRPTLTVARELVGSHLVLNSGPKPGKFRISEVEAYDGFKDKASHAHKGPTPRNQIMFGNAGVLYIYLCYGIHWMLNIVTGPADYPAAVLIRGVGEFGGPGILTKALNIDKSFNGLAATRKNGLWFENSGVQLPAEAVKRGPRIGVAYAGKVWAAAPYRFYLDLSKLNWEKLPGKKKRPN